jgi:hypothetical protein
METFAGGEIRSPEKPATTKNGEKDTTVAILASERVDQVVTSASHAVRASQPSTVATREYDDGLRFPLVDRI